MQAKDLSLKTWVCHSLFKMPVDQVTLSREPRCLEFMQEFPKHLSAAFPTA